MAGRHRRRHIRRLSDRDPEPGAWMEFRDPPDDINTGHTYVSTVRVVIEFAGDGQWSGTLHAVPSPVVDAPFEGRLDLLRLLEALVDHGHDDTTRTATADEKGEP
jgi:hypothetical protein